MVTLWLQVIKDSKLFLIVTVMLVVDIVLLGAWQIVDPLQRQTKELPAEVTWHTRNGILGHCARAIVCCYTAHMQLYEVTLCACNSIL